MAAPRESHRSTSADNTRVDKSYTDPFVQTHKLQLIYLYGGCHANKKYNSKKSWCISLIQVGAQGSTHQLQEKR